MRCVKSNHCNLNAQQIGKRMIEALKFAQKLRFDYRDSCQSFHDDLPLFEGKLLMQ